MKTPTPTWEEAIGAVIDKLLGHDDGVAYGNGYHDDCAEDKAEAKAALTRLVLAGKIEELNYILSNASGGGSWRRVISERIAELEAAQRRIVTGTND